MTLTYSEIVDHLADMAGILPEYQTDSGIFTTNDATKKALLKAMKIPADTEEEARESLRMLQERPFRRALPPVMVVRENREQAEICVTMPESRKHPLMNWSVRLESGYEYGGEIDPAEMPVVAECTVDGRKFEHRLFLLPVPQEWGYHTFAVSSEEKIPENGREMTLIVAPQACYMPECITETKRPWGFPLQLYSLKSARNWGIGDFSDLKTMIEISASLGAGIVGINPINTLFAAQPEISSPYYSSSRLFLNPLYIDVEAIPEAAQCKALQDYMASPEFREKLEKARTAALVDYKTVSELKNKALALLYADFIKKNVEVKTPSERGQALMRFCHKGGRDLRNMAVYQALDEYFAERKNTCGFRSWGKEYAHPDNKEVEKFAEKNADRVGFFMYLQWVADEQFKKAARACSENGLCIGLYQDLAVGVACESTETWSNQDLFPPEVSVGSPPDIFNPKGQEWGVAPMIPDVMKEEAYRSYRKILLANMENAGALRIDHVMGLARLFYIPKGAEGAYIRYPFEDLVGIVALESHRNRCLVVGEDLGIVPSFFREALEKASILSFRVFRYQRTEDGRYLRPEEYIRLALVAAGTHDMPTLPGFWMGSDIEIAQALGIYDDAAKVMEAFGERTLERRAIIEALSHIGRWFMTPESFEDELYGRKLPPKLTECVYRYLASSPSCLFLPQLEDVLEQTAQMNVPGTTAEYPNWRHKISVALEDLADDGRLQRICSILRELRG